MFINVVTIVHNGDGMNGAHGIIWDTDIPILLVDDHPVNMTFLTMLMQRIGFTNLDSACNGYEALEKIRRHDYQIALMDCQMPDMDGYQTTRLIREQEKGTAHHLIVLAVTANVRDDDRKKCLAAGMDDYIRKPLTIVSLVDKLKPYAALSAPEQSLLDPNVSEAEAPCRDQSASNDVVDLQHLESFTLGDLNAEKELLDIFFEQTEVGLRDLRVALESMDIEMWRNAAHRMCGASGNIGANALAAVCRRAEHDNEAAQDVKISFLTEIESHVQAIKALTKTRHPDA